jgi:hypothetical protein
MLLTGQTRRQFLNTVLRSSFVLWSAFLSPQLHRGVAQAQAPAKRRSEPMTVRCLAPGTRSASACATSTASAAGDIVCGSRRTR